MLPSSNKVAGLAFHDYRPEHGTGPGVVADQYVRSSGDWRFAGKHDSVIMFQRVTRGALFNRVATNRIDGRDRAAKRADLGRSLAGHLPIQLAFSCSTYAAS